MQNDAGIHPFAPSPQSGAAPVEFSAAEIAQDNILPFFHYAHLPPKLQETSKSFFTLARHVIDTVPRSPQRTVALRKLLEAKDATVRANLPLPGFGHPKRALVTGALGSRAELGEPVEVGDADQDRDGDPRFND